MRKLMLILIALIAAATFIRAYTVDSGVGLNDRSSTEYAASTEIDT